MRRRILSGFGLGTLLALAAVACGDDSPAPTGPDPSEPENAAPSIAPVPDQSVTRNTLEPRGLEIALEVDDPDGDTLTVSIESDDEDVVASTSFTCLPGAACTLASTPSPARTARATVQVTVADGDGEDAATEFAVDVVPRLVTNTSDGDPGSLRHRVATAEPGDVIGFDTDGAFAEAQTIALFGQIVLDRPLTIEGPGADALTLSGNGVVRVFEVSDGATVAVDGVTIADGRAAVENLSESVSALIGGGVFVDTGSRLTLSASVVTGNVAEAAGSAIGGGLAAFEGTIIVRDGTVVTGNGASSGGGIGVLSLGGSEAVAVIENSVVSDNAATGSGGGVVTSQGALIVEASEIVGNTAGSGGGIASSGGAAVIRAGSVVAENVVEAGGQGGGGIRSSSGRMVVTESEVVDNIAGADGGGIRNGGILEVTDALVARNVAETEDEVESGGGIYNSGSATLSGAVVDSNRAVVEGGGIHNATGGTLLTEAGTRIADNEVEVLGGGVFNDGDATLGDGVIEGNAAELGAGVYNIEDLTLAGGRIADNAADFAGGGVFHQGSVATTVVAGATIEGNTAELGGGVYVAGDTFTFEAGSEVRNNTADQDGGGLYFAGNALSDPNDLTVDGSTFEGNTAVRGGGIYFVYHAGESSGIANLRIEGGSLVRGNEAAEGGGIFMTQSFGSGENARLVVDGSTIEENVASAAAGGGLLNEGGRATIQGGGLIADNTAVQGGGIGNRPNEEDFREVITTVADATVSGNEAELGGGVHNETVLNLGEDGVITANTATDPAPSGGGVYNLDTFNNDGDVSGNSPDDVVTP